MHNIDTLTIGGMRVSKGGGWVKASAYEEWREYALALESKLRQLQAVPVDAPEGS